MQQHLHICKLRESPKKFILKILILQHTITNTLRYGQKGKTKKQAKKLRAKIKANEL